MTLACERDQNPCDAATIGDGLPRGAGARSERCVEGPTPAVATVVGSYP